MPTVRSAERSFESPQQKGALQFFADAAGDDDHDREDQRVAAVSSSDPAADCARPCAATARWPAWSARTTSAMAKAVNVIGIPARASVANRLSPSKNTSLGRFAVRRRNTTISPSRNTVSPSDSAMTKPKFNAVGTLCVKTHRQERRGERELCRVVRAQDDFNQCDRALGDGRCGSLRRNWGDASVIGESASIPVKRTYSDARVHRCTTCRGHASPAHPRTRAPCT